MGYRLIAALAAAGTTVTNSTAETVSASHSLAANHLQAGKKYRITAAGRAPATNATDTLKGRLRFGPTTLTGDVLVETQAIDVANDDSFRMTAEVYVRSAGASSVCEVQGEASGPDDAITATGVGGSSQITPDTTAALLVEATLEWSVDATGNQAAIHGLEIEELV